MPIDMIRNKLYEVDYDAFYKEINAASIFNHKVIQKKYIEKWVHILKRKDDLACRDYLNSNMQKLILKEKEEAPEIFQLPVIYNSNNMFIHFRVSRIIQMIESSRSSTDDAIDIDIEEFIGEERIINWTSINDDIEIKGGPIIMVPLALGKYYNWVVIDGNHRITDAIAHKVSYIKALCLDANFIVANNLFCTRFDKFLYIFQNEIMALATYIQEKGYSDENALRLSYPCSQEVQCLV